jgi:hypothetical protein
MQFHQNPNVILLRNRKINPKIHLEPLKALKSRSNPEQKEQTWRYHNTRLQIILQSPSNKNSMTLAQKQTWKTSGTKGPEIRLHNYSHLIFDKGAKNIHWRKDSFFHKWCWENWLSICRLMKLDPYLSSCTKINSTCSKDLNIRTETLKLL